MNDRKYNVLLAGIPLMLNCRFAYPVFEDFHTEKTSNETITAPENDLSIEQRYALPTEAESPQYAEFMRLLGEAGSVLLKYNRCIFHGTAFIWHEKAWIFTAPSGTGKTTQYVLWKLLYKDEISILNGDKPILEFRDDNTVFVHPSPWKGKENMGIMRSAPLGGIILLKQGAENHVRMLPSALAALPLYLQFMFLIDKTENIDRVCALETRLLRNYPVWELTNLGDEASAELMHDTLMKWEQQ